MSWFIPNIEEIRKLIYFRRTMWGFIVVSTLLLKIGVFILSAYAVAIITYLLAEKKCIWDIWYMCSICGEIVIFKIISYFLTKEFGYDFWGQLNSNQYQKYVCENCLTYINEDDSKGIFRNSVRQFGWKNISFANENYSFIQIQYLLDLLLDNTYNDKTIKDIVEEYIVPMLSRYKNRKDIINLILQHTHLSIKRLDKEENMEVYLLLYSSCLKLQLEDTLSTTECNLCNFVNSFERRQKLSSLLVLSQYNLCRPVLSKVDAIILKSRRQDLNSSSSATMVTMEDFK